MRVLVAIGVMCLCLAAAGSARPAAALDSAALLARFQPVLYFHAAEDWAPETAETFVGRAKVEKQVSRDSWRAQAGPPPTSNTGCTLSPCYRLNLPCRLHDGDACYERDSTVAAWKRAVVYGRVLEVPPGSPPPPGLTTPPAYLVRYWFFYDFDDYRTARERLWQAHEGDWESVTVGLDAAQAPLFAAYSQHCSGTVRPWANVRVVATTHPAVYVALGSHANYFENVSSPTYFAQCLYRYVPSGQISKAARLVKAAQDRIVDRTGTAHPLGPPGLPGVAPAAIRNLGAGLFPRWARFPGRWSEGQLLWLGRTPHRLTSVSEGYGPATPNWTATSVPSLWHAASS